MRELCQAAVVIVSLALLLPLSISKSANASSTSLHHPGGAHAPFSVQRSQLLFKDAQRATPARGEVPGHAGRLLLTDIFRPERAAGPLPVILFAHGWDSSPDSYDVLLRAWASAGYLVVAPILPDSAAGLPGSPISNYPAQARDLSFLITKLLQGALGHVDRSKIAVAGHSDGGTDVALMALDPSFADHRVRAYLSLSGEIPFQLPGPWDARTPGSLLVAVGGADEYGLAPRASEIFAAAQMHKVLVSLDGGDHLGSFVDPGNPSAEMRAATLRFLAASFASSRPSDAVLAAELRIDAGPALQVEAG